ncbi:MAG: hypothetical protein FWE46_04250 [Coriobacteriia bacterium]|nr:hypothetical protein [Coriobacteriia bacterium]MCL2537183.1 hypothetical protein [Coriobacteriia bacterium]
MRHWISVNYEEIKETVEQRNAIFFQYGGDDYFIEMGSNGFVIQDPRIGHEDDYDNYPYLDYAGSEVAKTSDELFSLTFLDGMTIEDRFEEIKFFLV